MNTKQNKSRKVKYNSNLLHNYYAVNSVDGRKNRKLVVSKKNFPLEVIGTFNYITRLSSYLYLKLLRLKNRKKALFSLNPLLKKRILGPIIHPIYLKLDNGSMQNSIINKKTILFSSKKDIEVNSLKL